MYTCTFVIEAFLLLVCLFVLSSGKPVMLAVTAHKRERERQRDREGGGGGGADRQRQR